MVSSDLLLIICLSVVGRNLSNQILFLIITNHNILVECYFNKENFSELRL